jgi:hypothetical protein
MPVPKRLLALDVRISKLGFAVFEGPTDLLDWGVRSFEKGGGNAFTSSVSDRLGVLFDFYEPSGIAIRSRNYHLRSHERTRTKIMAIMKSDLRRHSRRLTIITAKQVRNAFAKKGEIHKHDIALQIANQFQELSWKLPPRRKAYQSELAAMLVFDAVATGITYFRRRTSSQFTVRPRF